MPASDVTFLADRTWVDPAGQRHVDQSIFDAQLAIIAGASKLIVLDQFLYNDFQGPIPETTRELSAELTEALIRRKQQVPDIEIVMITDPVNTLYGGLPSRHFAALREHGIRVVITDLDPLHDSNPFYSAFWRVFIRPFGNGKGGWLPNPIGPGKVSLRTYLRLINFKANHRKTLLADNGDGYVGLVSSANPHDGSSAHRNAAIRFNGPAVAELLATENAVLALSGEDLVTTRVRPTTRSAPTSIRVVTEDAIKDAVLRTLEGARPGDRIDLMMFYLSDRDVIGALKASAARGAELRILLDPNKDAFGREKNGVPNRPVAFELNREGVEPRWCHTHGEQCHAKMLLRRSEGREAILISGSANFTRRNLDDLNLETDVVVTGPSDSDVFGDALAYFEQSWFNEDEAIFSVDYTAYEDRSWFRRRLYRFMEWSGFSAF